MLLSYDIKEYVSTLSNCVSSEQVLSFKTSAHFNFNFNLKFKKKKKTKKKRDIILDIVKVGN